MNICVRIEHGVVTDANVGDDPEWVASVLGGVWMLAQSPVSVGWTWDGTDFAPPYTPDEETPEEP